MDFEWRGWAKPSEVYGVQGFLGFWGLLGGSWAVITWLTLNPS